MTNHIPYSSILHVPALDGACGIQLIISGAAGRMHSSALAAYGAKCVGAGDMRTVTKQSLRSPNEASSEAKRHYNTEHEDLPPTQLF